MGIAWKHQGRTTNGIDCAGLVVLVAKELGLSGYDSTDYGRSPQPREFMHHFGDNMRKKPVADAEPGDVLLFRDRQFPCHSAIVGFKGTDLTIIHAHAARRKVVEDRLSQGDWLERRSACFEFYGVEEGQLWLFS